MFEGKKTPYTEKGIGRTKCRRCGEPSVHQWTVCANGNRFLGICQKCDNLLNEMALKFMGFSGDKIKKLMDRYKSKIKQNTEV